MRVSNFLISLLLRTLLNFFPKNCITSLYIPHPPCNPSRNRGKYIRKVYSIRWNRMRNRTKSWGNVRRWGVGGGRRRTELRLLNGGEGGGRRRSEKGAVGGGGRRKVYFAEGRGPDRRDFYDGTKWPLSRAKRKLARARARSHAEIQGGEGEGVRRGWVEKFRQ